MDTFNFLPVSKEDMQDRGWWYYDFLVVTADADVDHPSVGTAIIATSSSGTSTVVRIKDFLRTRSLNSR